MAIKSLAQTLKDLATGIKNTITGVTGSNATLTITKGNGTTSTVTVNNVANATKATQDSAGQQINTTYIKGLSVSGKTITYTKGNGTTGTITTQDTAYSHPNSGVTANTYRSVTVNAQGHVTAGSNPTTLAGYGITDAATAAGIKNVVTTVNKISNIMNIQSGLNPDGSSNGKTPGTPTANAPSVPPTSSAGTNPSHDSSGNSISSSTVLVPTGTTPIPQNGPTYTIYNSNGSTSTSTTQKVVVFTDAKGTIYCKFDVPADSGIYLDTAIGIKNTATIEEILRMNIALYVRDTDGRTKNMWINSEGVATLSRQKVTNKCIGVWNDSSQTNTFIMVIRQ